MRKLVILFGSLTIVLVSVLVPSELYGWGQHRYHGHLVRQSLDQHLKMPDGTERFSKKELDDFVELYSYYPDWGGGTGSKKRDDDRWGYYLESRAKARIEGTHSLRATVQYFKLLLDCLIAGDTRNGIVWAGCLAHVIGDAAAANHPPLLAYLTYCHGPLGLTLGDAGEAIGPNLKWIDVAGPVVDEEGKKLIQEGLKDYRPKKLAETVEEAAVKLQILLHDNWLTALEEEAGIAAGFERWTATKDAQGKSKMLRGMARIIARCTRDTADAIYTAHILALKQQTFDVDKAMEKGRPRITEHRRSLKLSHASLYAGLLRESSESPAIGLFLGVPPIYWVSSGSVDLQFCYFMNLIGRTLAAEKTPYLTFDMKLPPTSLDPKKVPVVILPPYRSADGLATESLEKMLREYRESGGKILFIGGHPASAIEPLGKHLERTPSGDAFYPFPTAEMPGTKLILRDKDNNPVGNPIPLVQVMKDFDTRAFGAYTLKAGSPATIAPVLSLERADKRLAISNGLIRDGRFEMIYAPWYLFVPGALTDEKRVRHLDRPTLSPEGARVLNHLLAALK
jgi:hypothetical protein